MYLPLGVLLKNLLAGVAIPDLCQLPCSPARKKKTHRHAEVEIFAQPKVQNQLDMCLVKTRAVASWGHSRKKSTSETKFDIHDVMFSCIDRVVVVNVSYFLFSVRRYRSQSTKHTLVDVAPKHFLKKKLDIIKGMRLILLLISFWFWAGE